MGLRGKLARDTAVLTGAAVVMRCVGMVWQIWLAGRIGAAGLGLWQLVASVNVFTSTLAISGIRFTTTRLVSEELGAGRSGGAQRAVQRCLGYAAFLGLRCVFFTFVLPCPTGGHHITQRNVMLQGCLLRNVGNTINSTAPLLLCRKCNA